MRAEIKLAEEAGIAAFNGLVLGAGPSLCALNIDMYVAAAEPVERDAVRLYLERTQRPQGITVLRQKWRGELPASRRRTYILTTADTLVPPEQQRVMAASVGADVVEIAADHGIVREQPARLAELLVAASRFAGAAVDCSATCSTRPPMSGELDDRGLEGLGQQVE